RPTEQVPLLSAHRRVLAENVVADRDYPALRRSLRDGFAVHRSGLPGTLWVRGQVRAGEGEQPELVEGEALEIMTGAPVPKGADAVVMVEHVTRTLDPDGNSRVHIERTADAGQFINERGAEAVAGTVLIRAGTALDAAHIATLAMTGHSTVRVCVKPRVAILATGDEIVDIESNPAPHQIRNSNSYMLTALVASCGGVPEVLPVARDTREALEGLLKRGLGADMLIISGGVSAGRYDLVKPTLRELGAEFHFERVRIQPGGPISFATVENKAVFGLPGNPGSTLVTFQLFPHAALQLLAGETQPILPLFKARFDAPFHHRLGLTRFLPASLSADGQHITHIPWQGSSDVPALSKANVFLVASHDREAWAAGDEILVMAKL
ncbi:MAG: molybdopterin molybdotransferase MoeA, partial [Acidobacteriaceae bacterium]|nr:molybdopterin molybdotransferase MoeA [Acidobacteriaceae bacterium]